MVVRLDDEVTSDDGEVPSPPEVAFAIYPIGAVLRVIESS